MHSEESVKVREEQSFVEILISRVENLNALNPDVLQSLLLVFEKFERNSQKKVILIKGDGEKAFVAGADIKSMYDLGQRAIADYAELGQRVMRRIECYSMPVIACVNGYALGGGMELALACDLIIASKRSKFGQPEINLGIIPGFGGTQRLLQRIGIGTTRKIVYLGTIIEAEEAYKLGVIDMIVENDKFQEEIEIFARNLSQKAPIALMECKRVLRESTEPNLLMGLRYEVEGFIRAFATDDRKEGMRAFLEKRNAEFKGS
jgi:enoyl-CoA hydratase